MTQDEQWLATTFEVKTFIKGDLFMKQHKKISIIYMEVET